MGVDLIVNKRVRGAGGLARLLDLRRMASVWKGDAVRLATTANITLSGEQTIDSVAAVVGDRVLVKDQSTGANNGIYRVQHGTWLRTSDADHSDKLTAGTKVVVQEGTTNAGTTWRLSTANVVLGTTAQTWASDGGSSMSAASILAALLTVDGSGSGLDADLLDGQSSAYFAPVAAPTLTGTVTHTGPTVFSNQYLQQVATPFFGTDAANKTYVDTAIAAQLTTAFDFKASVRAATTANITLSGAQTIDGVSVIAGDRVLVKNQSTSANNGIYVAASGAWSRSTDADASAEVTAGLTVPVTEGTVNGGRMWMLITADAITLGTTALSFARVDTGDLQAASNLSDVASAATAFANIKQAADTSTTGVVELATTAETQTGTDTVRAVTPAGASATYPTRTGGGGDAVYALASLTGTIGIDLANGNMHYGTLAGNTTFTFTGATNAKECEFVLSITQDSTPRTITWPASVKWAGAVAPTLSAGSGAVDQFVFRSRDGGTTWYGATIGKAFA